MHPGMMINFGAVRLARNSALSGCRSCRGTLRRSGVRNTGIRFFRQLVRLSESSSLYHEHLRERRNFVSTPTRMFQQSLVREDGSKGKNGEDVLGEVSDEDKERLLNLVGVEHGDDKLAILFTCNVCETRSGKKISRQAYDNGVVIARCPGCDNLHLIADRLDYFGDDWDIEKVMEKHGDSINVIDSDDEKVLQLTFDAVKKDD